MSGSILVIVLHYNGVADTLECLASLARQTYGNMRTLVVDNGSRDPIGPHLGGHGWADVLELPDNRGWSGGNNAGIARGLDDGADVICLLNNDTVLPADAVARLARTAALLGPCILHPAIDSYDAAEGTQLDPAVPQPPGLRVQAVPAFGHVFEIDFLHGACVFISATVFRRIGVIDERFFLLCEDADFGLRAIEAGFHLYCDTSVRIRHKESRSFGGRLTPVKTYYGIRNTLLYGEKHPGGRGPLPAFGRSVAWTIWNTAGHVGAQPASWVRLLRWMLSDDVFARAVRLGLRDYALRRFGRISPRDEARLAPSRQRTGSA